MSDLPASLQSLEAIAREAAKVALAERDPITRKIAREKKPDGSIVTPADVAVEKWLRPVLTDLVGSTTVWGEELGREDEGEGGLWLIDPVDGTSNFAFGSPMWGITFALCRQGKITLGAIHLPDLGEMYVAAEGEGVYLNGRRLGMAESTPVQSHELVGCCMAALRALGRSVPGNYRCTGSFVVDGAFVASGRFRALVGVNESLYDVAASVLFGYELGYDITYFNGKPFDIASHALGGKISTPWGIHPKGSDYFV